MSHILEDVTRKMGGQPPTKTGQIAHIHVQKSNSGIATHQAFLLNLFALIQLQQRILVCSDVTPILLFCFKKADDYMMKLIPGLVKMKAGASARI